MNADFYFLLINLVWGQKHTHIQCILIMLSPTLLSPSHPSQWLSSPVFFPRFTTFGLYCDPFSVTMAICVITGLEPSIGSWGHSGYTTEKNDSPYLWIVQQWGMRPQEFTHDCCWDPYYMHTVLMYSTLWVNFENTLIEIILRDIYCMISLTWITCIDTFIRTGTRLKVTRSWGAGELWKSLLGMMINWRK